MTSDPNKTWKALTEPLEKGCFNCGSGEGLVLGTLSHDDFDKCMKCARTTNHYDPILHKGLSDNWKPDK